MRRRERGAAGLRLVYAGRRLVHEVRSAGLHGGRPTDEVRHMAALLVRVAVHRQRGRRRRVGVDVGGGVRERVRVRVCVRALKLDVLMGGKALAAIRSRGVVRARGTVNLEAPILPAPTSAPGPQAGRARCTHLRRLLSVIIHSTSSSLQLVQGAPCSTTLHRTLRARQHWQALDARRLTGRKPAALAALPVGALRFWPAVAVVAVAVAVAVAVHVDDVMVLGTKRREVYVDSIGPVLS